MRTLPTLLLAATATGTLMLVQPAGASGAPPGPVRYVRATTALEPSEGEPTAAEASAQCPKGWNVVAGGFRVGGGDGRAVAEASQGDDRRWYAGAWQVDSPGTTLAAIAVCLRTTRTSSDTTSHFELEAGPRAVTDAASCPGGHAVSGGVRTIGDATDFALHDGYPVDDATDADTVPDDGWHGALHYTGDGGDTALFDVHCVGGKQPAYRRVTVTVPAGGTAGATTWCPADRPVVGGGVRVGGAASGARVTVSRPADGDDEGRRPEDGWLARVTNPLDVDVAVRVHAVCR